MKLYNIIDYTTSRFNPINGRTEVSSPTVVRKLATTKEAVEFIGRLRLEDHLDYKIQEQGSEQEFDVKEFYDLNLVSILH